MTSTEAVAKSASDTSQLKDWRFTVDFEGLAWAVFDREGEAMNSLGRRATEELGIIVSAVENGSSAGNIRGLVIMSGKEDNFIAGADIREFDNLTSEAEVEAAVKAVLALFDRIERMKVPVVAAIHGFCLGGGLELALACHYRIGDREDGTRFGFPEVKLGIFPGLNGSVRSLKHAGAMNAMGIMLTGRMLRPGPARAMGLIDQLVPTHHNLRWAARKAVLQKRRPKRLPLWKRIMAMPPARGFLAKKIREKTADKVREEHYAAPFRLIDLFEEHGGNLKRMAVEETHAFAPLMVSDTARNLRRVFRLSEMLKKHEPVKGFKPLRVHVVGAGTMGGDIAAWCVLSNMEVSLQDLNRETVERALGRAKSLFRKRLKKKRDVETAMARLIPDIEGRHVARADVVIEAVIEKLDIKQKVLRGLEQRMKPDAVLATNTSSLPIEDIAKDLDRPSRLVGIHFFNPVAKLPLVEIVRAPDSDAGEVSKAAAFVKAINKFPLVTKSTPGFLVNRVLARYMMTAMQRFDDGESREKIDEAALKFGMPMGPLELADVVGIDICAHVAEILGIAPAAGSKLDLMVKSGKLGKKSGEGFYVWEKDKPVREDIDDDAFDDDDLMKLGEELVQPMLDECEKCLAEEVVESADHVDAGVIFGTGFAPFRGGPLHYLASKDASGNKPAEAA